MPTAQLGLKDRLVSGPRNYIQEGLDLLDRIPAPYFRGRAGSMFLSAISLLGYDEVAFDGERDYMKEILDYLDRDDELNIHPAFPQPLTDSYRKTYPLVTMLNAIAVWAGRST